MDYKNYYFCLDTETTSLWPRQEEEKGKQIPRGQITEISIIILDYQFNEVERYYSMISPYNEKIEWTQGAADLTGINKEICKQKGKPINEVVQDIIDLAKKYKQGRYCMPCLVAHNLVFDKDYLEIAFDYVLKDGFRNPKTGKSYLYDYVNTIGYDTMGMARSKYPDGELANYKLPTVAAFLGIDTNLSLHTSMDDTIICANIFKYFMGCLRGKASLDIIDNSRPKFTFQF